MKMPWEIDIPVALIFFNRPKQFKRVFEAVRKARPSKLFLIQDGARENNENDAVNIQKCRDILNDIDWECEVHTDFALKNLGCGRRIYTGLTNCFKEVDRLIILEDDCVPAQSFFAFCKDMLERYLDQRQVGMITGMNHLNTFEKVDSDYFFAKVGSIAGWATWKRTWDLVDYNMEFLNDNETIRVLKNLEKYEEEFDYLSAAGVVNSVNAVSNPVFPLNESICKNLVKLYYNDVGILTNLLYKNNIQAILENDKGINLGSVYETACAMELVAHGHNLFYFDSKKVGEVDFLINDYNNLNILPIEIKSGKDQNNFRAIPKLVAQDGNYKMPYGYVFGNKNICEIKDNLIFMPIYLIMFV